MSSLSSSSSSSSSSTPSLVDTLFQRSLSDLIKSLRSSPPSALSSALSSSLLELRSPSPSTKSTALLKLTYLSSLHFQTPHPPPHFPALELLASSHLPSKRIAYLSASLLFHPSTTDLLPLSTHQLHKDLHSLSPQITSLPLTLLTSCGSPDLSAHLAPDLLPLLSSAARLPIRRKAIAACLSVITLSPESAAVLFPKLVESLADTGTVAAAVNVFCELTAVDPKPYLPLAPDFYRVLVESKNNWVLIKVVKILGRLAWVEGRLGRKVVEPIVELIRRSGAKSLVFECVRVVIESFGENEGAVRVALEKVKEGFLGSEDDANLRYLGLHALTLLGAKDSWAVEENREVVIRSLTDPDANIRREALNLVMGMVFESNLVEISMLLIGYALRSDPGFANEILEGILSTCGRNYYEIVQDFDWYVSVLGDIARNPHCEKGEEIERQMVDIGLRVRDARRELVRVARDLLIDPALLGNHFLDRILSGAAWVSGEYVEFSKNPVELLEALVQPRTSLLPSLVRAVYIQAVFKVLVFCFRSLIEQKEANANSEVSEDEDEEDDVGVSQKMANKNFLTHESVIYMLSLVETALGPLMDCDEVEVQERAGNVLGFIQMIREIPDWDKEGGFKRETRVGEIVEHLKGVFSEELGPVPVNAQQKIPVPEGITLKENLADLTTILGDYGMVSTTTTSFSLQGKHFREVEEEESEPSVESTSLLAEHRKRHGLYYLPTGKDEPGSNDFPQANDPLLSGSHDDSTEALLKLTEKSLIPRKSKPTKPRPVVVRLDEGDNPLSSLKPMKEESKDDKLSGAVRDVLVGNTSSDKSSRRRLKDTEVNIESKSISQSKENAGEIQQGVSSSRSRHHKHGKDKHRSHKEKEKSEDKDWTVSSRGNHQHEKQKRKHRQRGEASLNVVPQAPVIQDFLL